MCLCVFAFCVRESACVGGGRKEGRERGGGAMEGGESAMGYYILRDYHVCACVRFA